MNVWIIIGLVIAAAVLLCFLLAVANFSYDKFMERYKQMDNTEANTSMTPVEFANRVIAKYIKRRLEIVQISRQAGDAYGGGKLYLSSNSIYKKSLASYTIIAHELGHAMHSYFSDKNQPREKSGYTIFLAEIASTTNEVLLINYLLSKAQTDEEKKSLYNKLFDEVKATIFRQTMFAEFEEKVHAMHEAGEGLTKDKLCNEYYKLNERYFGDVKLVDETKYEWARIPHFFNSFYVYKYATGMITAICFANRILSGEENAISDYFKFLSAGCSSDPVTILKNSNCEKKREKK